MHRLTHLPPRLAPPDGVENAERWLRLLRGVEDASDLVWAWVAYLEVVTLNALLGAPSAGLVPPRVPVEVALAGGSGEPSSGPSTQGPAPSRS